MVPGAGGSGYGPWLAGGAGTFTGWGAGGGGVLCCCNSRPMLPLALGPAPGPSPSPEPNPGPVGPEIESEPPSGLFFPPPLEPILAWPPGSPF